MASTPRLRGASGWEHSWEPARGYHEAFPGNTQEAIMGPVAERLCGQGWTLEVHQEQKRKCLFFGRCSNSSCPGTWHAWKLLIFLQGQNHKDGMTSSGFPLWNSTPGSWRCLTRGRWVGLFTLHHPAWYPKCLWKWFSKSDILLLLVPGLNDKIIGNIRHYCPAGLEAT